MKKIVLVEADSWQELYVDGVLFDYGHTLLLSDVLQSLEGEEGFKFKQYYIEDGEIPEDVFDKIFTVCSKEKTLKQIQPYLDKYPFTNC